MNPTLDYPSLLQNALRQVVRQALTAATEAPLGTFHFYVVFRTSDPGVEMPPFLRDTFPDEMRIILQHQFWDLEVDEDSFYVVLSFNGRRHGLTVPLSSILAFYDADQDFALRFADPDDEAAEGIETSEPTEADTEGSDAAAASAPTAERPAGNVVSMDAFRKKS